MTFNMGVWCRDLEPAGVINGVPGNHFELTDQSGNSSSFNFATNVKYVRAVVFSKNLGTASATFSVKMSTTAAMTGNPINVGCVAIGTVLGTASFIVSGFVPIAGYSFGQLITTSGGTLGTYDAIIDGL